MEAVAWLVIGLFVFLGFLAVVDAAGGFASCLVLALIVVVPISLLAWACSVIMEPPCYGAYSDTGEPCD